MRPDPDAENFEKLMAEQADRAEEISAEEEAAQAARKPPKEVSADQLNEDPVLGQFGYERFEPGSMQRELAEMYLDIALGLMKRLKWCDDRTAALHKLNSSRQAAIRAVG